jgi:hypothetical protein
MSFDIMKHCVADKECQKPIDDLIEAGWHVLDSDFDYSAFKHWKRQALNCFETLLGPEHGYTRYLQDCINVIDESVISEGGRN